MSKLRHHRVRPMPAETLDDLYARRERVYSRYLKGEIEIEAALTQISNLNRLIKQREQREGV